MRTRVILSTLSATVLLGAPAAFAATPHQIYNDMADNGRLDSHYTAAEIHSALGDPSIQGYGSPTVISKLKGAGPCVEVVNGQGYDSMGRPVPATGSRCQHAGVLGATASQPAVTQSARSGTLPFTGAELAVFALIGIGLLASGLILRRTSRGRS